MNGLSQYHRNTVPTCAEELQKILNVFKNIAYLAGKSTGELGFGISTTNSAGKI